MLDITKRETAENNIFAAVITENIAHTVSSLQKV
jgi:hypothetical protein